MLSWARIIAGGIRKYMYIPHVTNGTANIGNFEMLSSCLAQHSPTVGLYPADPNGLLKNGHFTAWFSGRSRRSRSLISLRTRRDGMGHHWCHWWFSSTPLYYGQNMVLWSHKGDAPYWDRWPYPRPQILCFVHGTLWLDFRCSCRLPNQVSVQISAVMFRAPWQRCSGRLWDRVDVDTMCRMCRVSDWFSRCNSMLYLDTSRYDIFIYVLYGAHSHAKTQNTINRWYPVVLFPQQTSENARGPRDHPSSIPGQCLEYLPLHCKWM